MQVDQIAPKYEDQRVDTWEKHTPIQTLNQDEPPQEEDNYEYSVSEVASDLNNKADGGKTFELPEIVDEEDSD